MARCISYSMNPVLRRLVSTVEPQADWYWNRITPSTDRTTFHLNDLARFKVAWWYILRIPLLPPPFFYLLSCIFIDAHLYARFFFFFFFFIQVSRNAELFVETGWWKFMHRHILMRWNTLLWEMMFYVSINLKVNKFKKYFVIFLRVYKYTLINKHVIVWRIKII